MAFKPTPPLVSEHGKGGGFLKPTAGKTPIPKKTVLPVPPSRKKPSYTAAQEATLHAKALLAPQYAQADTEAVRQNKAIQAYTTAAMQQLAGIGPSIASDYSHAYDQQSGLVGAIADSLKGANPNVSEQSLLQSIGAPQSQMQSQAQQLGNVYNGGAAAGEYLDALPLNALQSQGLAASTLAKLQPGNLALAGRQSLLSALAQQSDARGKIGEQLPALQQDWLNNFQSNKAKQQQLALEAQATGLKQANTDRSFKAQQDKYLRDYNLNVTKYNAGLSKDAAKAAAPNASLSRASGYLVDSSGKAILGANGKRQILPGFNTNAQGRVVKAKSAGGGSGVKVTASTLKSAGKQAEIYYYGTQPKEHFNTTTQKYEPVPGTGVPGISYPVAVARLVAQFGISRSRARTILNNYYAPDEDGRPGPKSAVGKRVRAGNAAARKGKDKTGLGIIVP